MKKNGRSVAGQCEQLAVGSGCPLAAILPVLARVVPLGLWVPLPHLVVHAGGCGQCLRFRLRISSPWPMSLLGRDQQASRHYPAGAYT
jgi:hypothetical protein